MITIVIIHLIAGNLFAIGNESYIFRTVSPEGGFTDKGVEEIVQDQFGFVWISTIDGIYKYDSYSYTRYICKSLEPGSYGGDRIRHLIVDSKNRVWAATSNGLNLYNRAIDEFELVELPGQNSNGSIPSIAEGPGGELYFTIWTDLVIYNHEEKYCRTLMLPYPNVHRLFVYEDGSIYAAFNYNGVYRITPEGNAVEIIPPSASLLTSVEFTDSFIYAGYDGDGIRIYHLDGKFHGHYNTMEGTIKNDKVNALLMSSAGDLWIGTYLGLDIIYSDGLLDHYEHELLNPNSIPYSSVNAIHEDSKGGFWIGTWSGGLAYHNRFDNNFQHIYQHPGGNSITNNYISSFAEDASGDLWIGTEKGGLNYYNNKTGRFTHVPLRTDLNEPLNVKCILCTEEDRIYIGTYENGFFYLDRDRNVHRVYLPGIKPDDERIYALAESDSGIWVGDYRYGALFISKEDHRILKHYLNFSDSTGLTSRKVTSFLCNDGDLWVGTRSGLNYQPAGKDYFYKFSFESGDPNSLISSYITMISADKNGNIWVATRLGGLSMYDRKNNFFINYTRDDGLAGNDANGILLDQSGYLWISTENGISRFDPINKSVNNYNTSDGLQGNQFIQGSAHAGRSGMLYFGGTNGYTVINPERIRINPVEPTPILVNFIVNNTRILANSPDFPLENSINESKSIRLKYKQSSISLEFTSDNYLNPSKNMYSSRLVGFNDTWLTSHENSVTYSNLNPGKYTFELHTANNDGIWSKIPRILEIRILPPWWKHPAAFVAYIIVFITGLLFIRSNILYRERMKSAIQFEKLKRENEETLHKLKLQFFTNISHEFKTPLTLILSPIQRLMREKDLDPEIREDLALAEKNSIRLKKLVSQFIEFRKLDQDQFKISVAKQDILVLAEEVYSCFTDLAESRKIDFSMNPSIEPIELWLDKTKIEDAILNILSNAFIHTVEGGQIELSIKQGAVSFPPGWNTVTIGKQEDQNPVLIIIKDTGTGIPKEELEKIFERFYRVENSTRQSGSGIGLSLAKDYVLMHGGAIQVGSLPGEGSLFVLSLPTGSTHLKNQPGVIFSKVQPASINKRELDLSDFEELKNSVQATGKDEKKETLLLIEDNRDMNRYLVRTLSNKYRVVSAHNGEEGFSMIRCLLPDIILSDIMLPGIDGMQITRNIKSDPLTSHIPVILITALSEDNNRIEGMEIGADAYLSKPLDMRLLFSTIHNLIENRKRLRLSYGGIQEALSREETLSAFDSGIIRRAHEYIIKNIAEPEISTTQLAYELNMSRTNLHRKLKSMLGQSTTEFIRTIRINRARELMVTTDMTISEISYAVGITSNSYFSKVFKEVFGINPSEYRRNIEA